MAYLLSRGFMRGHVTLQLSAVAEGVSAQRADKALLGPLVSVFDVFLERCQPLVAAVTIWAGEQLGKVIRCASHQV